MGLGNVADATLRLYRQIGVEAIRIPTRMNTRLTVRPLVPPTQRSPRGRQAPPWDEALLRRIMARIAGYGLAPLGVNLEPSGRMNHRDGFNVVTGDGSCRFISLKKDLGLAGPPKAFPTQKPLDCVLN